MMACQRKIKVINASQVYLINYISNYQIINAIVYSNEVYVYLVYQSKQE